MQFILLNHDYKLLLLFYLINYLYYILILQRKKECFEFIFRSKWYHKSNLFEDLNNSNANISFAQLISLFLTLQRLCTKGLKTNSNDKRNKKNKKY